jgi:hypothetical protein
VTRATVTSKITTTEITLAIAGRTVDFGDRNEYPVTALRLSYRDAIVTNIGYDVTEDGHPETGSVHPDFLNRPEAWPGWVRALVDEHRPTA